MSARSAYWPQALGGVEGGKLFNFKTCTFYIDDSFKKRVYYDANHTAPANYNKHGLGYELDLDPTGTWVSNFFFLDIDNHHKGEQRETVRQNSTLLTFLKQQTDLYREFSVNGGIHIIFHCTVPIYIAESVSKAKLMLQSGDDYSGIVFEFKQKFVNF